MDPTSCYLEMFIAMCDEDLETARDRALAALALNNWLESGGFYPPAYDGTEVEAYLASVLQRTAHLRP